MRESVGIMDYYERMIEMHDMMQAEDQRGIGDRLVWACNFETYQQISAEMLARINVIRDSKVKFDKIMGHRIEIKEKMQTGCLYFGEYLKEKGGFYGVD